MELLSKAFDEGSVAPFLPATHSPHFDEAVEIITAHRVDPEAGHRLLQDKLSELRTRPVQIDKRMYKTLVHGGPSVLSSVLSTTAKSSQYLTSMFVNDNLVGFITPGAMGLY